MKKRNKTLVFGTLLLATGLGVSLISMDFKPNNVELSSTNKDLLAFY